MRKSGFTLMEIVVALCLLTIIVVGFLPVFISANALNTNSERNYDAQVVMGIYMKERVQNSV
ncbi:MAG: prepilin-type N-terminal cleavage/methylation domain-containing protein [Erysipelothrix sp.]|nr:prepilin-type N-terminal cleavage/methylation domain-containing protein [Erysipelothrix sp.]